mmetsp:Transcript_31975/g.30489  ORF Transcript_31975/g.30489 Transcript_31975/m.30489 type:complete len:90 (-) Transcript_31975:622-891(-)
MNEYQNNMDISCESDLNNNTTRERDSQANYTSVESSEGCSIVASSDLSKSSTIPTVVCHISDVSMDEDEKNNLDLSNDNCLLDTIKKGK